MDFIGKIREKMGLNFSKMAQQMDYPSTQGYIQFENSKRAVSVEKLVRLWRVSKLSADEFMLMIEQEVKEKQRKKKK